MASTATMTTAYCGVNARLRPVMATSRNAVRSCAHAGTPVLSGGELRPLAGAAALRDDVFTPIPGTAAPGGPPA